MKVPTAGVTREGQPFTYDLLDSLLLSEFGRPGPWFAESSEPPNCCWAGGITPQFRPDSTGVIPAQSYDAPPRQIVADASSLSASRSD
jgi:hypothetical protein